MQLLRSFGGRRDEPVLHWMGSASRSMRRIIGAAVRRSLLVHPLSSSLALFCLHCPIPTLLSPFVLSDPLLLLFWSLLLPLSATFGPAFPASVFCMSWRLASLTGCRCSEHRAPRRAVAYETMCREPVLVFRCRGEVSMRTTYIRKWINFTSPARTVFFFLLWCCRAEDVFSDVAKAREHSKH